MARTRTIDRNDVIEAAGRVVAREGATRLTLDAVAAEAGISKASVLYDYRTKQALIKAVIEHRVATETARIRSFVDQQGDKPDAAILGLIEATEQGDSTFDRDVALDLAVALNQHNDLRAVIHDSLAEFVADVEKTASDPRRAKVMFLAIEGLKLIEAFGFFKWPDAERDQLIEDIRALLKPAPSTQPEKR
ncbi:MAG TPA: TetR/AcrR family transcriptional regulator [Hyphomicrobiaceae bacterium]|nr:TetR/AcrR family transcriptional regulator [Hyphomicrobiaceae bacterium]